MIGLRDLGYVLLGLSEEEFLCYERTNTICESVV